MQYGETHLLPKLCICLQLDNSSNNDDNNLQNGEFRRIFLSNMFVMSCVLLAHGDNKYTRWDQISTEHLFDEFLRENNGLTVARLLSGAHGPFFRFFDSRKIFKWMANLFDQGGGVMWNVHHLCVL